jgi:hypothetical protein
MRIIFILTVVMGINSISLFAQRGHLVGKVTEVVGNQMPSPTPQSKATSFGVVREIFVFELTNQKQATRENYFYKSITTRLIAKKKTKADGSFQIKLKAGKYSIFVKEQDGFFANQLDGEGNINKVVIEPKKTTSLDLRVDYKAAY